MTTIVYRDGVIAADTAVHDSNTYCGKTIKIRRDANGRLAGASGSLPDSLRFLNWFDAGTPAEEHPAWTSDTEGLIVERGRIAMFSKNRCVYPFKAPFIVMGSGANVAMGALLQGATAEQAVRIAAKVDAFTKAPFTVLKARD